jgi:outer membrane protein assembly factor BamB
MDLPLWSDGSVVYATPSTTTNLVYCLNAPTMTTKWTCDVGSPSTGPAYMAFTPGSGVPPSKSGKLYVAAGTNIKEVTDGGGAGTVTHTYTVGTTVNSGPIPFGSVVYAGVSDGTYQAYNISTQALVTNWPYYGASGNARAGPVLYVPTGSDTLVIFGTYGGNLHAFRKE